MIANVQKLISRRERATGHAVYSPSQIPRILRCPASVMESLKVPPPKSSSYAERGTLLHKMVEVLFEHGPEDLHELVKDGTIERFEEQYVLSCRDYTNLILATIDKEDEYEIGTELEVNLKEWGLPEIWGTTDLLIDARAQGVVHVVDWKFGSGVTVYANDNAQAMAYAAGAIGFPAADDLEVHIHICQPPVNHYDEAVMTYGELKEWVFDKLTPGIEIARKPDAPYVPGEQQCRFCPAAMICRARRDAAHEKAAEIFQVHSNFTKGQVSLEELVETYHKCKEVMSYASDIAKYLQGELMHGRPVPGLKLVSGRSNRSWIDEDAAKQFLIDASDLSEDDLYVKKFVSPAQAEKLDRTLKKDPEYLAMWEKAPGNPQMVDESDPRPALKPELEAEKVFAKFTE